ncbi:MAG TPA: histidine kinase [Gemmatimonadales bacterium]|jgi:LytS/YehU family sensor histidine kinase|nr:histidine kinase [Gemmatimonadales bacterium]
MVFLEVGVKKRITYRLPVWALVSLAWVVPGALAALELYARAHLERWNGVTWRDFAFDGVDWAIYGLLTPAVFWVGRRAPLQRGALRRSLAIHLVGALALCVAWAVLGTLVRHLLHAEGVALLSWILTTLPFGVAVYFAMLGVQHATTYFSQSTRLTAQLADARLAALRMQLHPHFLYNSLNAATVIVRDRDSATAARMLEVLGEMLHRVMRADRPQEVPLSEELEFVRQYLAIEQIRFPDRLHPETVVPDELLESLVPDFILQPLVENAIRHGLAQRVGATMLRIEARREGADLVLTVTDDGPGPGDEGGGTGVGLSNTRERLQTLYGARGSLTLARTPSGGAVATIRLPFARELQNE